MEYRDERINPSDKEKLTALGSSDNLSASTYCRVQLTKELKQE